jgi:phosphoribosylaminoimidazole-succinocarboxamide synthase
MLLVDTKYEFGRHADGTIMICDEMHTPDSSRYWVASSYDERMAKVSARVCTARHPPHAHAHAHAQRTAEHSPRPALAPRCVRLRQGAEPENIDKEFLRLWFRERCDPYTADPLPVAPPELVTELASRYIQLYEVITGEKFVFDDTDPSSITAAALGVSE